MKNNNTYSRVITFSLLLSFLFTITACSDSSPQASTPPTEEQKKEVVTDVLTTISLNTITSFITEAKEKKAIPLPDSLKKVESSLKAMGQSELMDGLKDSLNESAAISLDDYSDIIKKTISSLNIPQADTILNGGPDSMTRYLEKTASSQLKTKLIPFVLEAVKDTEAQGWIDKMNSLVSENKGLIGSLSSATGIKVPDNFDPTDYVTDEIMGQFFNLMADQEKLFRADPQGRSSELYEQLMSAVDTGSAQ